VGPHHGHVARGTWLQQLAVEGPYLVPGVAGLAAGWGDLVGQWKRRIREVGCQLDWPMLCSQIDIRHEVACAGRYEAALIQPARRTVDWCTRWGTHAQIRTVAAWGSYHCRCNFKGPTFSAIAQLCQMQ
jgi:hypothetical protein